MSAGPSRKRKLAATSSASSITPAQAATAITIDDSDEEATMDLDAPAEPIASTSAAALTLTGRKAWLDDVATLKSRYGALTAGPLTRFTQGDSEESIEFKVTLKKSDKSVKLTLVVSEAADYLKSHTFMGWADDDVPDNVTDALDGLGDLGSVSLTDALLYTLRRASGVTSLPIPASGAGKATGRVMTRKPTDMALDEDEGYDSDMTDAGQDELFGLSNQKAANDKEIKMALRRDFRALVDAGYRPGYVDAFVGHVITVSTPISALDIPARSLDAWDPKLINADKPMHLVLIANYGPDYTLSFNGPARFAPRFVVGISTKAKPDQQAIEAALRSQNFTYTTDEFEAFSVCKPLDKLMNDRFLRVYDYRQKHRSSGWAGAEHATDDRKWADGVAPDQDQCYEADIAESELEGVQLPEDPMVNKTSANSVPLAAMAYLVRRFILCPRFCTICHSSVEHVAVRPFVCEDPLCAWQYQDLALGPDIEYEIRHNVNAVDLLVQFAYIQAATGQLTGLPALHIQVSRSQTAQWVCGTSLSTIMATSFAGDSDDLDKMAERTRANVVCACIQEIPPIAEMKGWLEGEGMTESEVATGKTRKLTEIRDGALPTLVWKVLRWIITSNTSYLREINDPDELISGVTDDYRQYRFIQSSPQKEAAYDKCIASLRANNPNLARYPNLYAWHGSTVSNWHSILRQGLHFNKVTHGRAYGHGVYMALDAATSLGSYAQNYGGSRWRNARRPVTKAAAICQVVNAPDQFVSQQPHYVVNKVEWIQTRWLLVQQQDPEPEGEISVADTTEVDAQAAKKVTQNPLPAIVQDPKRIPTINHKPLSIPNVVSRLERVASRDIQDLTDEYSPGDAELLAEAHEVDDDDDVIMVPPPSKPIVNEPPYEPFAAGKLDHIRILPPPRSATATATMAINREMRSMMQEQSRSTPRELGWYFDPELPGNDNSYHWIVEMISFDPDLPLSKDMKQHNVPGLLFEILFSPQYPFSPPFIRVVWPRLMRFIDGGGGHVTGGGSLCMDLLTTTGWSSVYTLPAILLQIKMAISNLEPRPARLDQRNWDRPYEIGEAIEGFRRAAATHNWQVPADLDAVARGTT